MALAFDANASGSATGTSLTIAHTNTGTNQVLFVGVQLDSTSDLITGVKYNAVAMTRVTSVVQNTTSSFLTLYALIAPKTGLNNIVISTSASVNIKGVSASYTGAKQSNQPETNSTGVQNSSTNITNSITILSNNSWVVAVTSNDIGTATNGTNYTNRTNSGGLSIGDSNAAESAGSFSQSPGVASNANWAIIQASFTPVSSTVVGITAGEI